mmetsp:Transcript_16325/g.46365  ORF Transcript_16325/g.46365 Transcript_16325/m.46365 type:complete len:175 (-) Transcript_16325:491-1015(-)
MSALFNKSDKLSPAGSHMAFKHGKAEPPRLSIDSTSAHALISAGSMVKIAQTSLRVDRTTQVPLAGWQGYTPALPAVHQVSTRSQPEPRRALHCTLVPRRGVVEQTRFLGLPLLAVDPLPVQTLLKQRLRRFVARRSAWREIALPNRTTGDPDESFRIPRARIFIAVFVVTSGC